MPGLNIVFECNRGHLPYSTNKNYVHGYKQYLKTSYIEITADMYECYPIVMHSNQDFTLLVEGYIYDVDKRDHVVLFDLAEQVFNCKSKERRRELVNAFISNTDGEFNIVFYHHKSHHLFLLNDALGRLPIYYYKDDNKIILSRNIAFVLSECKDLCIHKMGVVEYLIFGYPLGRKTIYSDVSRILPNFFFFIKSDDLKSAITTYHQNYNFDEEKKVPALELANSFVEATKNRANIARGPIILGLSGGLDSRAVAAALNTHNIKYDCVSFKNKKSEQKDLDVATEVAKFLNIDHKIFEVNNIPSDDSISEQFNHKKGLNSIRMSFIIPFFKELRKVYGAHSFNFTGDGGDKMLVDLSPLYPIHTEDELVDYILKYNTRYHDVRKVCDIFNLPIGSLKEQIREIITGYPEKSIHNKYVHFIIYERAFKWLYEGEDRNRAYFWSTSPFYSVHFFKLAMQVSSRKKASYKLYRNFLFAISPGVARLKNANWNRRLNLNNIVYVHWLLELLRKYPAVKKYIKRNVKPQHTADAEFRFAFNYLRRKIDSNRRIYEHVIVIEKLETLLQNKEELSKPFIYDMSTIFQVLLDIKERE